MSWIRLVKVVVGIGLIGGGAGLYLNGRLRLTATYAAVASPATVIRAVRDGVLTHSMRPFSVADAGASVGSLSSVPANDPELRAVSAELDMVRADVSSLKELLNESEQLRSKTAVRQSALGTRRVEHLKRLINQADLQLATKRVASKGAELVRKRAVELCSMGLMSKQECDSAVTNAELGRQEVATADGQAEISRSLLDASRSGVDVAENIGSEVTYARQRQDDLTLRIAALKQQLETQQARAKALELRVSPPSISMAVASRSRTWSILQQNGALVVKGEPLFEVVDCEQLFVFATLTEDRYEQAHIGMRAVVKYEGRAYEGKLAQLMGPYGTFTQDRSMQPQPPVIVNGTGATSGAVGIEVPALAAQLRASCGVGTRVEVELRR